MKKYEKFFRKTNIKFSSPAKIDNGKILPAPSFKLNF